MNKERKNELVKIAFDCRKATSLIEKKQETDLSNVEKLELKLHLAGCAMCRLYQQQSLLINSMMRQLFKNKSANRIQLDDSYKEQLKKQIENKLGNAPGGMKH